MGVLLAAFNLWQAPAGLGANAAHVGKFNVKGSENRPELGSMMGGMMGSIFSTARIMAKPNPLQAQLLKAGLVKKSQVSQVAREQHVAHHAKATHAPSDSQREAVRVRAEKTERDRQLAAEHKAQARSNELRAQARQIIEDKKWPRAGEVEYRFSTGDAIRTVLVNEDARKKLAAGVLVIAQQGERFELLPRVAADKVRERAPEWIVLDHGSSNEAAEAGSTSEDDAYYAQFKVPDDLMW